MRKWLSLFLALVLLLAPSLVSAGEEYYLTSFDYPDLDGNALDPALLEQAQLVLLNVWEPWCEWCLAEMPDLNELYELNRENGLLVVGISGLGYQPKYNTKETAASLNITYPLAAATISSFPFEVNGFPMTFVYQRQENGGLLLLGCIEGYLPRDRWNQFLKSYLPGAVTAASSGT
ncbi:MAG: TlpA family protein disulfide reductase [Clostridia bacterium]|nr:TlpA family protein disulfide reductase [Clostridia bacterium]